MHKAPGELMSDPLSRAQQLQHTLHGIHDPSNQAVFWSSLAGIAYVAYICLGSLGKLIGRFNEGRDMHLELMQWANCR